MADNIEIDIDVNDNSGNRGGTPVDNSPGVSSQDENFAPLTGGGAQQSNRKGTPLGPDVYRPKGMEAAPEFLNLLSILSSHFSLAREIFLPLRKVYQLHANTVKKEAQNQKKRERTEDFDEDEALITDPDVVKIDGLEKAEDFLKAGYRPYKRGQNLPWIDGKPQGRAEKEGTTWVDPVTSKVHGKEYEEDKDPKGLKESILENILKPFKQGFNLLFKPLSKSSKKVWKKANNSVIKNFKPLVKFGGLVTAGSAAVAVLNNVLIGWANQWKQFSPQLLLTEAMESVKTTMAQMDAARRTDNVMSQNAEIMGEQSRQWLAIQSTLVDMLMPGINSILRLGKPILDLIQIGTGLMGVIIKPIFTIIDLISEGITMLLAPLGWAAESIQAVYDVSVSYIDWARGLGKVDKRLEPLEPLLEMMGMSNTAFTSGASATNMRNRNRGSLPGVVR